MSIQITIKSTQLFKTKINFDAMIKKLDFDYGAYDEKSILVKKSFYGELQTIIFNPKKIGMGIFFDGSKMQKGIVVIIIQDYTPKTEIEDTYKLINYICENYKKSDLFINDEYITLGILHELKMKIIDLSFENLKLGCKRTVHNLSNLRLALLPIEIDEEFRDRFGYITELTEFEDYIHEQQKEKYNGS